MSAPAPSSTWRSCCRRLKPTWRSVPKCSASTFHQRRGRSASMSYRMRVRAFAKINRSLRVLGTRDDGYHELRTIFQSIALHDTLTIRPTRGAFELTCDDPLCPIDGTNLVARAAARMWTAAGRRGAPRGIAIDLRKRIPMQAGLGGGSSDAAAALRALARRWRVGDEQVRRAAAAL